MRRKPHFPGMFGDGTDFIEQSNLLDLLPD